MRSAYASNNLLTHYRATAVVVGLNFGGLVASARQTSADVALSSEMFEQTGIITGLTLLGPIVDMCVCYTCDPWRHLDNSIALSMVG